jgi:hypothetical protein
MGVADQLSCAVALIQKGYCIGPNAVNGVAVRAIDPEAAAWSLYGALLRVTGEQTSAAFAAVFGVVKDYHVPNPRGVGAAP